MFVASIPMICRHVTMDVGDNGVGVPNAALRLGNDDMGVHDTLMNAGDDGVGIHDIATDV